MSSATAAGEETSSSSWSTSSFSSSLIAFQTTATSKIINNNKAYRRRSCCSNNRIRIDNNMKWQQRQSRERHHHHHKQSSVIERNLFATYSGLSSSSLPSSSSTTTTSSLSSSFSMRGSSMKGSSLLLFMAHSHGTPAVDRQNHQQQQQHRGGDEETQLLMKGDKMKRKEDNKAMAFLRKIGKIGGDASKQDFRFGVGFDEGSSCRFSLGNGAGGGNVALPKSKHAYRVCTETGIVDDMREPFPCTSSGSKWIFRKSTCKDHQRRGTVVDDGDGDRGTRTSPSTTRTTFTREFYEGRISNVVRGFVRSGTVPTASSRHHLLPPRETTNQHGGGGNGGGCFSFFQMATSLTRGEDRFRTTTSDDDDDDDGKEEEEDCCIDASKFDGIELDVRSSTYAEKEIFHVQFKRTVRDSLPSTPSSFRATFTVHPDRWMSIRIPWCEFLPHDADDDDGVVGSVGSEADEGGKSTTTNMMMTPSFHDSDNKNKFTATNLSRVGILASDVCDGGNHQQRQDDDGDDDDIEDRKNVLLAISGFRFYKKTDSSYTYATP